MMNQNETESKSEGIVCATCGLEFVCAVAVGQSDCWCFHLPQVRPVPTSASAGCLCPTCLQAAIDEATADKNTHDTH